MKKIFFVTSIFFLCSFFSLAQAGDNSLRFPYKVNFTPAELQLLNSLDEATLMKLIIVAQNLLKKNSQTTATNNPNVLQAQTQPMYSNSPSAQTPNYNPQTGQYQSAPVQQSVSSTQPQALYYNPSTGQYVNIPSQQQVPPSFVPVNQSGNQANMFSQYFGNGTPQLNTPLGNIAQGITQGLTGGSVDLSKLNVPDFCKTTPNYGATQAGRCLDMQTTTSLVKETMALACAAINKPVPIISASRSGAKCNNGGVSKSQHLTGKAVDIAISKLSSVEKQKVFEVFKKKGFEAYGCYGVTGAAKDEVHLDHGPARHWGPSTTGSDWDGGSHCPQELFLAGYAK